MNEEKKFEYIKKNPKYNDCIVEGKANSLDEFKFNIQCNITISGPKTNYKIEIDRVVYCCGETYEDCLEAYFIQNNKWTYCNDINIVFCNSEDQLNYKNYFYKDKDGISRYANCGGNMD